MAYTLSEIAGSAHLPTSTAHRLASELVAWRSTSPISASDAPRRNISVAAVCRSDARRPWAARPGHTPHARPSRSWSGSAPGVARSPGQTPPATGSAAAGEGRTPAPGRHPRATAARHSGRPCRATSSSPRRQSTSSSCSRGDLARAQPQARQQQQDREVASADQPAPVTTGHQPLDRRRLQAPRQRAIPQIRDRGQRPHQRRLDPPCQMQIAQERAQRGHQIPRCPTRCASGTRASGTCSHRLRRAGPAQPARAVPAGEEQPRRRHVRVKHRVRDRPRSISR